MLRRTIRSVILALALLFVLAAPAFAGGGVVTLDGAPSGVQAGVAFTVGFTVISAHDGSAQSGLLPEITAFNASTQEKLTVAAEGSGADGHYVATLTLPSDGEWTWSIYPFGIKADYPASMMTPIQVRAAVAKPASGEPIAQTAPAAQTTPDANTWTAIIAVAAAGAIASFAIVRARRRSVARS